MSVKELLAQQGETEEQALREHSFLMGMAKISRYEAECAAFEKKYGATFEQVKKGVDSILGRENFGVEDDIMDWEYAHTALAWWREQIEELRRAG